MKLKRENTAVLALSPGGVVVGEQIARRLHSTLALLLTAKITAPGDESLFRTLASRAVASLGAMA